MVAVNRFESLKVLGVHKLVNRDDMVSGDCKCDQQKTTRKD